MTNYTPEVKRLFRTLAPDNPRFFVEVAEYPQYPGLLFLQVYQPLIDRLTDKERVEFSIKLSEMRDAINMVTPCDTVMVEWMPYGM